MPRGARPLSIEEILQTRVSIENECWIWTGYSKPIGRNPEGSRYGRFSGIYAHVLVYVSLVGEVPEGMELDHLCRKTLCVNPAHLQPVIHRENVLRGEGHTAKNARKTKCPNGHAYTKKNTRLYTSPQGQIARICRACEYERSIARRRKR